MLMPDWRNEVPQTLFLAQRKIKRTRPGFGITRLTNGWTGARIAFLLVGRRLDVFAAPGQL